MMLTCWGKSRVRGASMACLPGTLPIRYLYSMLSCPKLPIKYSPGMHLPAAEAWSGFHLLPRCPRHPGLPLQFYSWTPK